jgi:N-methylhydantoinase A
MAADLGMAGVVIPLYPGVYSAMGLLMSDVKHDYIRSRLVNLTDETEDGIGAVFAALAAQAYADLVREDFQPDRIGIEYALDMRYAGQGYEMTLRCPQPLPPGGLHELRSAFDEEHRKCFGHTAPGEPIEIVSWRVRGIGRVPPITWPEYQPTGMSLDAAVREVRKARFGGKMLDCPVYQRERLDMGVSFSGPAIVDQPDCTSVIMPDQTATVDAHKNIIVDLSALR